MRQLKNEQMGKSGKSIEMLYQGADPARDRAPLHENGSVTGAVPFWDYTRVVVIHRYVRYETPLFQPVFLEDTRNQIMAGIRTSETTPPPIERAG